MSLAFNIVALIIVGLFVAVFAAVPVARWRERRGPGGLGRRLAAAVSRAWTAARQWAEDAIGPDPKPTCGWHTPADGIGAPPADQARDFAATDRAGYISHPDWDDKPRLELPEETS